MAALEKIRNKAGLLIGFVGFALFAFIIGDFITNGSAFFNLIKQKVGKVEGHVMTVQEYSANVQQFMEVAKMEGQNGLSDAQVRDNVWDKFVYSSLLATECEKIGLSISDDEFQAALFGDKPHPMLNQISFLRGENGRYDANILKQVILNKDNPNIEAYYKAWKYWETELKNQILLTKYQKLLYTAMAPTKKVAENLASLDVNEYDLAIVRKSYYDVPDSTVTVTDNDIKAVYQKQKEAFKTEPYRSAKIILFDIYPSKADYDDAENAINITKAALDSMAEDMVPLYVTQNSDREYPYNPNYLNEKQIDPTFAEFAFSAAKGAVSDVKMENSYYKVAKVMSNVVNRPDSVRASRIVVFRNNMEDSQKLADSLMAELKKGADFAAMVKNFSKDSKALIDKDGDMEWLIEGVFNIDGFDDATFTANVGDYLSFPISASQAVMLVKVTDKTAPVKKVKLAEVINKVEASTDTYREIYDKARQFALKYKTLDSMEAGAKRENLDVRSLTHLERNQNQVAVLPQAREIIRWVWDHKVGEVSDKVFELNNQYVVAAVSEIVEDDYVPFEYAKAGLEGEARNEKKAEMLLTSMAGMAMDSVGVVDTIKAVRVANNYIGRFGAENQVLGNLSKLQANQVSEPIKGMSGVYLVKLLDKRTVEVSDDLVNQIYSNQASNVQGVMYRNLFDALKKTSKIDDTRYEFY